MNMDLTEREIISLARLIQDEHRQMRELLGQVATAVVDHNPDGVSVAYLDGPLLDKIRRLGRLS